MKKTRKTPSSSLTAAERDFEKALNDATKALKVLADHEIVRPKRLYTFYFMRGVLQSLGVLVAIAIIIPLLLPLVITLLRQIEWVPILGDTVSRIITQVEERQESGPEPDRL